MYIFFFNSVGASLGLTFHGFANITSYFVISGLAMGMEPICGQEFGAKRWYVLGLTLLRIVLILLCATLSIGLLWCIMKPILLLYGQDESIINLASTYIIFSLPDLITQSFLHPHKIYLRNQNITLPLALCAVKLLFLFIILSIFY